ncbi:putative nucleoside-diphosphate-sugar epimerase [Rhexocercosporidium sp. MPI-PUGE-AT-0058]|nr:putative nucleoside-diphosphate-sugar epimerase [Rhexocercosporidium sp. MPI-PUGE-AT-0058]
MYAVRIKVNDSAQDGGSVIKHILVDEALSKEFKIRGVTRDTSKPAAEALTKQGVEVVTADLNSKDSLAAAIKGSHTVSLMTNYWEGSKQEVETAQGTAFADASKEAGISHLIFSSLLNVTEESKGKLVHVPHFYGKADIEKYIRATGLPSTFVLPVYFMTNYTALRMMAKQEDGSYLLAYPVSKDAKFPLILNQTWVNTFVDKACLFVKAAIKNQSKVPGNQILAAADYYTPEQIVAEFTEVTGKKDNFVQVPSKVYKSFLPPAIAHEMLENHLFVEEPGYYAGRSLEESHALLDGKLITWTDFLKRNITEF